MPVPLWEDTVFVDEEIPTWENTVPVGPGVSSDDFSQWYSGISSQQGLDPNPDDPRHFYDYRKAYAEGVRSPDESGHFPSQYKTEGHPRTVVDGVNTITGQPAEEEIPTWENTVPVQPEPVAPTAPPPQDQSFARTFIGGLPTLAKETIKGAALDTAAAAAYMGAGAVKGATLGYVDPSKYLEGTPLGQREISKPIAGGVGQFLGAAAPITATSKVVGTGLKASKALTGVRPILQRATQAGATGLTYGGAHKPEEETIANRAKNALESATFFIGVSGTGELISQAAKRFGKTGQYNLLKGEIIERMKRGGATAEQAEAATELGIKNEIAKGGGWEKVSTKDIKQARGVIKKGGRFGEEALEPKPITRPFEKAPQGPTDIVPSGPPREIPQPKPIIERPPVRPLMKPVEAPAIKPVETPLKPVEGTEIVTSPEVANEMYLADKEGRIPNLKNNDVVGIEEDVSITHEQILEKMKQLKFLEKASGIKKTLKGGGLLETDMDYYLQAKDELRGIIGLEKARSRQLTGEQPVAPVAEGTELVEPSLSQEAFAKPTISEFRVGEPGQGVDIEGAILEGTPKKKILGRAKELQVPEKEAVAATLEARENLINEVGRFRVDDPKINEEMRKSGIPQDLFDPKGQPFDEYVQNLRDNGYISPEASTSDAIEFLSSLKTRRVSSLKSFKPEVEQEIVGEAQGKLFQRVTPGLGKDVKRVTGITKPYEEKTVTEKQALYLSLRSQARGAKLGFREGKEKATQQIKSAKEILDRRRSMIKSIQKDYTLSDNDLKKVSNRDIRLMNNYEFKTYLDDIDAKAATLETKRDAKIKVLTELNEKEFQKVDNLRKYMKLPSLDNMTTEQLNGFNAELEKYQKGDEFLSVRKLETVKNTELKGIQTTREAREILAKKLNVPLSEVENIKYDPFDKYRFDAALADKNPFYQLMVDETNTAIVESEQKFYEYETELDVLVKKARASKSRGLTERAIPSDEIVFDWLEAKPAEKAALTNKMTDAEIDLASYLQSRFAQFRDYLLRQGTLEKYREDYITHIRRDFLEAWKEDGILAAGKEVVTQAREDAAVFKILEDDTENILPLEKFFKFAMQRTGGIKPSKNVAKAFKSYASAMLKKQALDKIIPTLDIYAHTLSPRALTPRGLEMDRRLVKFVKEWINNKKGRRSSLGGIIPQGGIIDIGLRAGNTLVTMIDLGLNIPVGLAATAGEQTVSFTNLGSKKYALGLSRMSTSKGKKIIEDNRGFVGKSLWDDLADTADNIGDTFSKALFGLFHISSSTANKVHLLGSLTEAEWAAGKISTERKAELTREMGRYRAIPGSGSILGSTSTGKTITKYKTWAIPVMRTNLNNIGKLTKMIAGGKFKEARKSREFQELFRATMVTSAVAITGLAVFDDDDKDDGFISTLLKKTQREALTLIGAMSPSMFFGEPRLGAFLKDLADAGELILKLEEYKTKPGLKGVAMLKRTVTPRVIKTIVGKEEKPKKITNPYYRRGR